MKAELQSGHPGAIPASAADNKKELDPNKKPPHGYGKQFEADTQTKHDSDPTKRRKLVFLAYESAKLRPMSQTADYKQGLISKYGLYKEPKKKLSKDDEEVIKMYENYKKRVTKETEVPFR